MTTVAAAAGRLSDRTRILVFTGAGISTESGIPDFRGPHGLWKRLDPNDFTLERWVTSESFRIEAWGRRFAPDRPVYRPNDGHRAIADLWRTGHMIGCITQNIDGLHQAAGLPDEGVAEVHGNASGIVCYAEGHDVDVDDVRSRWEDGETDPRCAGCGSILKSTTVLFGENLPPGAVARAQGWTDGADAVIAVGSTLSVYPAAYFPLEIAGRGDPFVIVNEGPTDHDRLATVRIEGKAGDVLPELVGALIAG